LEKIMSVPLPTAVAAAAVANGAWKLGRGRAMSLRPRRSAVLTLVQGRVWATLDGPHQGGLYGLGDHVLEAGDRLSVPAGRRLVIESWDAPAAFEWAPAPQLVAARVQRQATVARSLADLRQALALAMRATGRLVAALAGWPRARAADNCAHGASQVFPA
jgi:hypothetical protein